MTKTVFKRQQRLLRRVWRRLWSRRLSPAVALRLVARGGFRSVVALLMVALLITAAAIFGLMVLLARVSRSVGKSSASSGVKIAR